MSDSYPGDEDQEMYENGVVETNGIVHHEPRSSGSSYNAIPKLIRDKLAQYFVGPGLLPFQWKHGNVAV